MSITIKQADELICYNPETGHVVGNLTGWSYKSERGLRTANKRSFIRGDLEGYYVCSIVAYFVLPGLGQTLEDFMGEKGITVCTHENCRTVKVWNGNTYEVCDSCGVHL